MENLLLLHGALGSAATLSDIQQALAGMYNVYTQNFSGHGGLAIPQQPYSMDLFSKDILKFLDDRGIQQTHIFGYSMGGYAALYFAMQNPDRVKTIFTLATKFAWSPEAAEKEIKVLNPEKIKEKVPQFAHTLSERHAPQDWKQVMYKTAEMMQHLGATPALTSDNMPQLQVPVLLGTGDRDNMVTIEETLWAFELLPNASLLVLPATRHPLETVAVPRIAFEIDQFISSKMPQATAL